MDLIINLGTYVWIEILTDENVLEKGCVKMVAKSLRLGKKLLPEE